MVSTVTGAAAAFVHVSRGEAHEHDQHAVPGARAPMTVAALIFDLALAVDLAPAADWDIVAEDLLAAAATLAARPGGGLWRW